MAAPRWASFERSCDQYGRKLRADHGGSTPGGVLERAARPQPSNRLSTSGAAPPNTSNTQGTMSWPLVAAGAYFSATSARFAGHVLAKAEYVPACPVRSACLACVRGNSVWKDLSSRSLTKKVKYVTVM